MYGEHTYIYYRERPAVLYGRLVIIHNCYVIETTIDPYSDMDELKSHIVNLLGVNLNSQQVHIEGVRSRLVPNTSVIVYTLFELGRNNHEHYTHARLWRRVLIWGFM